MNLVTKVKSYSFWVSLASALILILKLIGQRFGFSVDEGLISDLFTSLCAILVIMGIIVIPSPNSVDEPKKSNKEELKNEVVTKELEKESTKVDVIEDKVDEVIKTIVQESQIVVNNNNIDARIEQEDNGCEVIVENLEVNEIENQPLIKDNCSKLFDIQSFIDKVCIKRAELGENIANFAAFLKSELENLNNDNNILFCF